jgi:hypothetical protein
MSNKNAQIIAPTAYLIAFEHVELFGPFLPKAIFVYAKT